MTYFSFASGGDSDTLDYIAYVAKDGAGNGEASDWLTMTILTSDWLTGGGPQSLTSDVSTMGVITSQVTSSTPEAGVQRKRSQSLADIQV